MDDTKELILELVENARDGVHTEFEQLRFFNEYIAARIMYKSLKKVIEDLEYSADNLFNTYCGAVKQQQADVNLLLAYKQLQLAVNYYKEESRIIKATLKDFENWLWNGNVVEVIKTVLFGEERDLWNIR